MPLLLLPPTACATATAAAAPASVALSRPPSSRLRCSHLPSAFPRLRKYGRRSREPVAAPTSDDDDEEWTEAEDGDYDEDEEEMEVDEEEFLATRPKPLGFGEGKTYATDIEEQLLQEMGLGGAGRRGDMASAKRREGNSSATKQTGADLNDNGVQVRVWNLPKKKNIHKDLKQAFKGFPGLLSIDPAVSANKKTRDPICKGFAYLKLESTDAATRFVEIYSHKPVAFGKVQKPISCCIVDGNSSVELSNKASHAISQSRLKHQILVVAS
ncbi:hypothetical protein BAE44_0018987 [Dichanthelium oligosanthes]|uniref:RRM domain-containing protein n=1 Tax=Dichanthelium oligosanthes TaxID=888268 RepID=A0A1E5V4M7_9POAL|nr:hypothetical protein BAE44_0018987 [Dichanthelium oligosanthes]